MEDNPKDPMAQILENKVIRKNKDHQIKLQSLGFYDFIIFF